MPCKLVNHDNCAVVLLPNQMAITVTATTALNTSPRLHSAPALLISNITDYTLPQQCSSQTSQITPCPSVAHLKHHILNPVPDCTLSQIAPCPSFAHLQHHRLHPALDCTLPNCAHLKHHRLQPVPDCTLAQLCSSQTS